MNTGYIDETGTLLPGVEPLADGDYNISFVFKDKNENVTTDVLVKICTALQCDIGDIMEMVPETADRKDAE